MLTVKLPPIWDARKFALRYELDFRTDFYINGLGELVVLPVLADDPPIFELPDPPRIPRPTIDEIVARIEALELKVK
jgi:hypothetical protein